MNGDLEPYAQQSPFSNPGSLAQLLDCLPAHVPDICSVVQSLLLHIHEAHLYGVHVPKDQMLNMDIEHASEILTRVVALDDRPLTFARPAKRRLPVSCRQFVILTCAMLRHKRIPARTRSGFADYLPPDAYVAHSICEHWDQPKGQWTRVDPQIDAVQKAEMRIAFDPLNIPSPRFLTGAEAWHAFRAGEVAEKRFQGGTANLRNLLALDLLELNCLETHGAPPSIIANPKTPPSIESLGVLDSVADRILQAQGSFSAMRALYEEREEFQIANQRLERTGVPPATQP